MTIPVQVGSIRSRSALWPTVLGVVAALVLGMVSHTTRAQDAAAHFESKVRPLLIARCTKCHGAARQEAHLRLDTAAGVRQGGDSGAVVTPQKPGESRLMRAVRHEDGLKMPPDGRLSDPQIADLFEWVKSGARWPGDDAVAQAGAPTKSVSPLRPDDDALAPNLQLWLRADSLKLADGESVHVWPDQSAHGRDMSATKGIRTGGVGLPAKFVKESQLQRRPGVRFETGTGLATSPQHPVAILGDAAMTLVLVMNLQPHTAQPPHDGVLAIGNPANPGSDPGKPLAALVQFNQGEDHALHFAGGWNHDASAGRGSFKPYFQQPIILTATKRPGPMRTTSRLFINGEALGTNPAGDLEGRDTIPDIQHRTDIGVYMGKALDWSGSIVGDVGEVLIYNRVLTDIERIGLETHLAEKYAIPVRSQTVAAPAVFSAQEKSHWAYQPVQSVVPPVVKNKEWAASPIDRFVLAKLEAETLGVSPRARPRTLIRRVTLDLTGLPPAPEEVDAFLKDDSPQAYNKVVNRLLDSPHYGERWARHWLDVVRYAETTANDANAVMRFAWRYRNYVIDAFNRDLPYDQFLVEQLAGDLLPPAADSAERARQIIATGYLMIGPKALAETDKEQSRIDIVDDQIDVTGRAFLGLTVACARCHDHKFDAIRTTDYYGLAGIFRSTEPFMDEARNASMWWEFPLPDAPGASADKPFLVMAPKEAMPRDLRVHLRGNRFTLGDVAPRGFVQIISAQRPAIRGGSGRLELARWIASPQNPLTARVIANRLWQHHFGRGLVATSDNFGTRGERPSHPELLDSLADDLMQHGWSIKHLQRRIVLSNTYQQAGRETNGMNATAAEDHRRRLRAADQIDPENHWLVYFPRRRLSAEELRDAVLAVSGQLDRVPGTSESSDILWKEAEVQDAKRGFAPNRMASEHPFYTDFRKRSIYLPVVRNMQPDVLALFDVADPNAVTTSRNDTTVPSQSLFLLNSRFLREQSKSFAERLQADAPTSDDERIHRAHQLAFSRPATESELVEAKQFLQAVQQQTNNPVAAWTSYCQTLLCQNEFLY